MSLLCDKGIRKTVPYPFVLRHVILVYLSAVIVVYVNINGPAAVQAVGGTADSGVVGPHRHFYFI